MDVQHVCVCENIIEHSYTQNAYGMHMHTTHTQTFDYFASDLLATTTLRHKMGCIIHEREGVQMLLHRPSHGGSLWRWRRSVYRLCECDVRRAPTLGIPNTHIPFFEAHHHHASS